MSLSVHYESKRYDIGGYDVNFNPLPDVTLARFFILNGYADYVVIGSGSSCLPKRGIS